MKPLHSEIIRLSRCPCCQSPYSSRSARKTNTGKSAARQNAKRNITKELKD